VPSATALPSPSTTSSSSTGIGRPTEVFRPRRSFPPFTVATPWVSVRPYAFAKLGSIGSTSRAFSIVSGGVGAPPKLIARRLERS
jgi:hypothetical protein